MEYYLITAKAAQQLNVMRFRRGSTEVGYIVTSGDLVTADDSILKEARRISEREALEIIKKL